MDVQEFILKIEQEFEDLEPGKLQPDSIFRDHFDWNSINALVIIALIDAEYDVAINANDLKASKTINDLFGIIKKRKK